MVYYRKYRPQKIEELDSSEVREKLYSVLKSPSVSHAFLFTGPKGLGKTSTARIVAKAVNCEVNSKLKIQMSKLQVKSQKFKNEETKDKRQKTNDQIEPCNKCYQCISITNGTNIDVLEIDGASNRGIDEIRDLREKVKLSPASATKKVYIIDEVHMLTTEAFNALLKTLEEPPSHVMFILCTTEPHKVPATIASRCFHIQFNKATIEELISSFERIIKSEKVKADKEALGLIASMSDGSFRDGSKILEEMVLAADGKELTKELIEKKYQISNINSEISQMIEYLAKRDTKKALDQVSKLTEKGLEMGYFIERMIQDLHSHFLQKAGVENSSKFIHSASSGQSSKLDLEIGEIKRLIEILSEAHGELKYAVLPQLPLELAIVEWSMSDAGIHVRGPVKSFPPASAPLTSSKMRAVGSPSSFATPSSSVSHRLRDSDSRSGQAPVPKSDILRELIDKVKSYNHSIAGVLRGCRVISYDKDKLIIEAGFKFHKERLDDSKTKEIIRKAVSEIAEKEVEISVTLK